MFKKTLIATALLMGSTAALAEISGNVALTSDYVFRGISQTNEDPAIQGGLDYSHDSGFYAGVWGSNIEFGEVPPEEQGTIEIDVYAGLAGEVAAGLGYDVGVFYYAYPGSESDFDYDYVEVMGSVSYPFTDTVSGSAALWYSPEFFGKTGDAVYVEANVDVALASDFGLAFHVGTQSIDDLDPDSYIDWSVGISKEYAGLGFDLTYTDTDDDGELIGGDLADSRVVFTISKEL